MKDKPNRKTGEAVAVYLSLWLGMAAMTVSQWWSVFDPVRANPVLLKLGSWMPGWWGIGPYAGKETAGLVFWLAGWAVAHLALRNKELPLKPRTIGFAAGFFAVLVGLWPPVYHAVFGWLPAVPH